MRTTSPHIELPIEMSQTSLCVKVHVRYRTNLYIKRMKFRPIGLADQISEHLPWNSSSVAPLPGSLKTRRRPASRSSYVGVVIVFVASEGIDVWIQLSGELKLRRSTFKNRSNDLTAKSRLSLEKKHFF